MPADELVMFLHTDMSAISRGRAVPMSELDQRLRERPQDLGANLRLEFVDRVPPVVGAKRVARPERVLDKEAGHAVGVVPVVALAPIFDAPG